MGRLTHLLDTDMVVEVLRGRSPVVDAHLVAHEGSVAVSAISISELRYGAQGSSDPSRSIEAVNHLLAFIPVLDVDTESAIAAGDLRSALAARGEPLGPYDLLIAGQAVAGGLTLATGNVQEFRRVPGLSVENWRRRAAN